MITIEIAVTDVESARSAIVGGADRVELCSALSEGGLTPSYGAARACIREFGGVRIFPIIRPRAGDFVYTGLELESMLYDVVSMRKMGCKGIVVGALTPEGDVDVPMMKQLMSAAQSMQVTFHRAFDRARDPRKALEDIIALGCARILTSGQRATAPEGAPLIRELHEQAGGRIIIMPGSGVRPDHIAALREATGCNEFHASLRAVSESGSRFIHPAFNKVDYGYAGVEPDSVRALRDAASA